MSLSDSYTRTAIALHWLVAFAISATLVVGVYMHDLPLSPGKLQIYSWHKWAGVTIFLLVLFRLTWRLIYGVPSLPAGISEWQYAAAEFVHRLLYVLMAIIPLSGWLMSSAKGFQTVYFGVLPLPNLLAKNKELGETLVSVHMVLNFALVVLVLIHAAAAVKHHFFDRDEVLARMLPLIRKS